MSTISKFIKCMVIAALPALCAPEAFCRSAENAADANWTIHSSFYSQPRRIIDTPSRVYFFVHTTPYNTQAYSKYYNKANGAVFYLDKSNPGQGMHDLAQEVTFTGFDMRFFEVNPLTDEMAVAYENGGIDLISAAGKTTHIDTLKEGHNYHMSTIRALSFEKGTNNLFVCTEGGFVCIDTLSGRITQTADWRDPVNDIIPHAGGYIAIINNRLYEAAPGADITKRNSFKELTGIAHNVPLRLLSFSDKWAGFATQDGNVFSIFKASDGAWRRNTLVSNSAITKNANEIVVNSLEHNILPTDNGYIVSSPTKLYILSLDTEADAVSAISIATPSGSTAYCGSGNGHDFWFHQKPGKFVSRTLEGTTWSEPSEPYSPAAPHIAKDVHFIYSPIYGFLSVNKYPGLKAVYVDCVMPISISAYRNGKWTDLSPRKEVPYFVEEDPSLLPSYNGYPFYPVCDPTGALIDPENPDILMASGIWDGLAALYLNDPRRQPHCHVVGDSPYKKLGASEKFPTSGWGRFAGLYLMGTDGDNNIWATRSNLYAVDGSSNDLAQVWVLTPEARKQAFENGDPSLCGEWKRMEVDGRAFTEFFAMGKALRHPKNKNKLLLNGQVTTSKGRPLRVYNTNGTLDDSSDDTLTDINYYRRDDGSRGSAGNVTAYFEDPSTGDVYVSCNGELIILDLDKPVKSNTIDARSLSLKTEEGNVYTPFSMTQAYDMCEDEYGRLWIATSKFGVIGISPDRTSLVAQYCAENSPLPSNEAYSVGWNPETQSLFISTDVAIAEVRVDAPADTDINGAAKVAPFALPRNVTPDYAGTVAIHNVPAATSLRVRDAEGHTVALINEVSDGIAFWNLTDSDGNLVPSGTYTILDASGNPSFEPIILPVIR